MSAIIQTNQLTKSYGRSRGIIDVTFDIQEGEVFGFLGPNGAGKTTTMRTLMGLLRTNSGSATIGSLDCWNESTEVKKLVGYLPGEFAFDPGLRGAQILEYLSHLRGGVDQNYLRTLVERLAALTQHLAHPGRCPPGAGGRGTRHHGCAARYVTVTRSPAAGEGGCARERTARD